MSLRPTTPEPAHIDPRDTAGLRAAEDRFAQQAPRPVTETRPPLVIEGTAYSWEALRPLLAEAAGAAIIDELALDHALQRSLAARRITVSQADIDAERALLERTLREAAGVEATESAIEVTRRSRGLGPARWSALLHRNASLRALVRSEQPAIVTEEDLRQAHAIRHGPRHVVRVILTPTQSEAARVLARLTPFDPSSPEFPARFAQAAIDHSADPTGPRGGDLGPISLDDPSLASALRRTLITMSAPQVSDPILIDDGYVVLFLEAVLPGDGVAFEAVRGSLLDEVTAVRERVLMDRTARRLLAEVRVTPFDPSLHWSRPSAPALR